MPALSVQYHKVGTRCSVPGTVERRAVMDSKGTTAAADVFAVASYRERTAETIHFARRDGGPTIFAEGYAEQ